MSNLGQAAGAIAGGIIGFFIGGPIGAVRGAALGLTIGSLLFPTKLPGVQGPRLEDLTVTLSTYGNPIPLIYGTFRASGNIIWASDLVEVSKTTSQGGKGGGGQKATNYSYFGNFAVAVSGRNINRVKRIWANKKVIFDVDNANNPTPVTLSDGVSLSYDFSGRGIIRIYHGDQTIPDSTMVTYDGVGNVPNYKNIAYIMFTGTRGYALADFGNSIPNIEVEIEADEAITVGDCIGDIASRAGVTLASEIWVSDPLLGYAIGTQTSATDAMIPLALAYDFDLIEEYHQITVIQRPRAIIATIEEGDLAAHDVKGALPDLLPLIRAFEATVPIRVDVNYPDPDFDYQVATQSVSRQQIKGDLVREMQLPVVVTGDMARQVATRIMWGEAGERITASITLSDKWRYLRAGDTIALPVGDGHWPFRIIGVIKGQDNTRRLDIVYDDAAAYINGLEGAPPRAPENDLHSSLPSTWMVMDAPLLSTQSGSTGLYYGVHSGLGWNGSTFERTIDDVNYTTVSSLSDKASIGDVASALPAGSTTIFDELNTITVVMRSSDITLSTVSDLDVLNGANAFWLGDEDGNANGEIIQFRTATLVAPDTYELTGLLRGRLGTEFAVGLHGTNEVLVMLDGSIFDADFGLSDWNQVRKYVAYSRYVDESLVMPRAFTNTGERAKPRSPVHVTGIRDVSNNLTIGWIRRTRIPISTLVDLVPLGETSEEYEIDIMSGPTVLRTITATSEQASYSAADQTTDGLTPGDPVTVNIYQLSNIRGRGHAATATI